MNYKHLVSIITTFIALSIIPFAKTAAEDKSTPPDSSLNWNHNATFQECKDALDVNKCIHEKWKTTIVDRVMLDPLIKKLGEKIPPIAKLDNNMSKLHRETTKYYDEASAFSTKNEPLTMEEKFHRRIRDRVRLVEDESAYYNLGKECHRLAALEIPLPKSKEEMDKFWLVYANCMNDRFDTSVNSAAKTVYAHFREAPFFVIVAFFNLNRDLGLESFDRLLPLIKVYEESAEKREIFMNKVNERYDLKSFLGIESFNELLFLMETLEAQSSKYKPWLDKDFGKEYLHKHDITEEEFIEALEDLPRDDKYYDRY